MNAKQEQAIRDLCERYGIGPKERVDTILYGFMKEMVGLPKGYYSGWILRRLYVGVSPEGHISS